MEKGYSDEQYIRILFGFYPPHHDNCGLKSRINGMAERIQELVKNYGKDKILTESELMKSIENILSLSVDDLRLHMFAQVNRLKQEEGKCYVRDYNFNCGRYWDVCDNGWCNCAVSYSYLAYRANKDGECWSAIPTIAREIKLSEATVRCGIRDLEKIGLVKTEQGYHTKGGKSSLLYKLK